MIKLICKSKFFSLIEHRTKNVHVYNVQVSESAFIALAEYELHEAYAIFDNSVACVSKKQTRPQVREWRFTDFEKAKFYFNLANLKFLK